MMLPCILPPLNAGFFDPGCFVLDFPRNKKTKQRNPTLPACLPSKTTLGWEGSHLDAPPIIGETGRHKSTFFAAVLVAQSQDFRSLLSKKCLHQRESSSPALKMQDILSCNTSTPSHHCTNSNIQCSSDCGCTNPLASTNDCITNQRHYLPPPF